MDPTFGDNGGGSDTPPLKTSGCFFLASFAYKRQPPPLTLATSGNKTNRDSNRLPKKCFALVLYISPAYASCTCLPPRCLSTRKNRISKHQNNRRQMANRFRGRVSEIFFFPFGFLVRYFPSRRVIMLAGVSGIPRERTLTFGPQNH